MISRRCGATALTVALLAAGVSRSVAAQQALGVSSEQVAQLSALTDAYHDTGHFDGVALVAHRGRVLFEKAYGLADVETGRLNTLDTRFPLASVSKPVRGKTRSEGVEVVLTAGVYLSEREWRS